MKKQILMAGAAMLALSAGAQTAIPNSGGDNDEQGLIQTVFGIKEKTDKFHLYLNTQTNFNLNWSGEGGTDFDGGRFAFKQLRIEFKGQVNDWISYRYRQRLNKGQSELGYFDNILKSIDIAEVGFRYKKVNFVVGKQCAAYGGIEFDLNPIEVYQYCDMIDYMDNFMTGVRAAWDITPSQQLQFQILDGIALNPGEMYGENITKAKLPFLYTVNWNGNFNNIYSTRWSASFMNEVKNKHMWYFAFGNQFNFTPRCGAWLDVMYSREGIDRKGMITNVVGEQDGHNALNTEYFTLLLHMNYFVHPKWNLFGKVAWERNGVYKSTPDVVKGTYGIDWLYVGGVEYYPLKDRGLHFFLTYVGQRQGHTAKAQAYGLPSHSYTNLLTAGFIWQIPLF
ncbi:MAG: hypothetical protein J1F07_02090 [Muribaculaceae bacterium]|nr:hypothetical protein [Muribaculaceae bacterium]